MTWLLITAFVLFAMAAVAKAAVDILTHQAGANVFEVLGPWWDARTSWKRKYRDYDAGDLRPRFWGSTGPLVLLTDFWHLADAVYLTTYYSAAFALGVALASGSVWWFPVALAGQKLYFGAVFELCYQRLFRKSPAAPILKA